MTQVNLGESWANQHKPTKALCVGDPGRTRRVPESVSKIAECSPDVYGSFMPALETPGIEIIEQSGETACSTVKLSPNNINHLGIRFPLYWKMFSNSGAAAASF